jgi:PTH1 family peptidyl-tRNA hydrolase
MRVRVGVGRPDSTDPEAVSAYVLGRFRESEAQVQELIERASEQVEGVVLGQDADRSEIDRSEIGQQGREA